jgi:hypothetical protein
VTYSEAENLEILLGVQGMMDFAQQTGLLMTWHRAFLSAIEANKGDLQGGYSGPAPNFHRLKLQTFADAYTIRVEQGGYSDASRMAFGDFCRERERSD